MVRERSRRGSALILAVVVTIITLGIGGAFLSLTLSQGKSQFQIHQVEDAQQICDAGLETARWALTYFRRHAGTWSWDEILTYNYQSSMFQAYWIKDSAAWCTGVDP